MEDPKSTSSTPVVRITNAKGNDTDWRENVKNVVAGVTRREVVIVSATERENVEGRIPKGGELALEREGDVVDLGRHQEERKEGVAKSASERKSTRISKGVRREKRTRKG